MPLVIIVLKSLHVLAVHQDQHAYSDYLACNASTRTSYNSRTLPDIAAAAVEIPLAPARFDRE